MFSQTQPKILKPAFAAILFCFAALAQAETEIRADLYGDNWYAIYVDGELVGEDSTPFKTERSFNSDSFTFTTELPAQGAVIMKDYYEDDTGLEYIGTRRQQMGDGGFAGQLINTSTGKLIVGSSPEWQCKVIHQAPLNKECARSSDPSSECKSSISEEPEGWMLAGYDDSDWEPATEHSAQAIRPRRGYNEIKWDADVKLIWGEDLEVDNIVLCRFTIEES